MEKNCNKKVYDYLEGKKKHCYSSNTTRIIDYASPLRSNE